MKFITLFHFDSGLRFEKTLDSAQYITKHFTLEEQANLSATQRIKLEIWPQTLEHARMREEFRMAFYDKTGKTSPLSSGYRTKKFNAAVGGIPNSLHLWGTASDLPQDLTDALWEWDVNTWRSICYKHGTTGEIGRYPWGIHIGSHIECTPDPYTKTFYIFDER